MSMSVKKWDEINNRTVTQASEKPRMNSGRRRPARYSLKNIGMAGTIVIAST